MKAINTYTARFSCPRQKVPGDRGLTALTVPATDTITYNRRRRVDPLTDRPPTQKTVKQGQTKALTGPKDRYIGPHTPPYIRTSTIRPKAALTRPPRRVSYVLAACLVLISPPYTINSTTKTKEALIIDAPQRPVSYVLIVRLGPHHRLPQRCATT